MVDGIYLNPFTQKVLTSEEIARLDSNQNGIVDDSESDAAMAWLSGAQDAEGEVAIEQDNSLFGKAVANGMRETANTEAEFKDNMSLLKDEYIEAYLNSNSGLTDGERTTIINLINDVTTAFINAVIQKKPESFSMEQIAKDYQKFVDGKIDDRKKALASVNNQVNGYKNSVDLSYNAMVRSADAADNGYISDSEWGAVRNSATSYLLGTMLAGNIDHDLLASLDPKYKNNQFYLEAIKAVYELKSCNDPATIQKLLKNAQDNITKFLDSIGRNSVIGSINDMTKAKEENAITAGLNKVADKWVEEQCTKALNENGVALSNEQIAELKSFAQTTLAKFMASLEENGELDSANMMELSGKFTVALNNDYESFTALKDELKVYDGEIETAQQKLVDLSDSAKASGYVSEEEKEKLVQAGAELIYQQLLAGTGVISLLQALNPNYANTTEFKDIQALATKLKTCTDPAEIQKLQEELKTKLEKLLSSYSGQQLVNAVDRTKPIDISSDDQRHALDSSSIGGDYDKNVTRQSSFGKQDGTRLDSIKELARKDIEAYATQLKEQLKAELGAAYDEALVNSIIESATNDTIALFAQNADRRIDVNNAIEQNERAFVFDRDLMRKKGRYKYNLRALIDTFTEFFNDASKTLTAEKNEPSKITYDKEDVLVAAGLDNQYNRDRDYEIDSDFYCNGINRVKAEVKAEAKATLVKLTAQIQAQLASKGCIIPSSRISELLDASVVETMELLDGLITFDHFPLEYEIHTKTLIDKFFDIFDKKLEKEKEAYKADEKKPEDEKPAENS